MGRTQPSNGRPPAQFQKATRAKDARNTANRVIPLLLAGNLRAKKGVEGAELIVDPGPSPSLAPPPLLHRHLGKDVERGGEKNDGNGSGISGKRKILLFHGDVLSAASYLKHNMDFGKNVGNGKITAERSDTKTRQGRDPNSSLKGTKAKHNPSAMDSLMYAQARTMPKASDLRTGNKMGVLNPASPLRPGGGFLHGSSSSDEDILCSCTTLYASLREEFYRLPELGGIWTPDALVFRESRKHHSDRRPRSTSLKDEPRGLSTKDADAEYVALAKKDMWFIDVLSAAMLRFPDVQAALGGGTGSSYTNSQDRDAAESKMRAALRMFWSKGCRQVVLPAWGVGTYGNPASEVALLWKKVLLGQELPTDARQGLEEFRFTTVMFAVRDRKSVLEFVNVFGDEMSIVNSVLDDEESSDEQHEEPADVVELRTRIAEMQASLETTQNPDLYRRLAEIVAGLERALASTRQASEMTMQDQDVGASAGDNFDEASDDAEPDDSYVG